MLTLKYFASLRDSMGRSEEAVDVAPETCAGLIDWLITREPEAEALAHPSVRLIVNDAIVPKETQLKDGDVVAFCPPFSGG